MHWGPSEYSPYKRTFGSQQILDLGMTLSDDGGFFIDIFRRQGGTFKRIVEPGKTVGLVFFATADNYLKEEEFYFEISVPQSTRGTGQIPVTRSKVEMRKTEF
jgi:hypothetical protein